MVPYSQAKAFKPGQTVPNTQTLHYKFIDLSTVAHCTEQETTASMANLESLLFVLLPDS